jgi:hypothetical protein
MLFDIIDTLENKLKESEDLLKKFSGDNLKSMLCIHSDISNKPGLTADLSTSTSHASDFELDSVDIKPVIVDAAFSENSCLNNCVKPKSKDTGTQAHGKFVPTCDNCGKIGHIRTNCYLLRSHRPWIKQDALRKSEVEDSSSSKQVPPYRRHIKGKGNVICKNANHNSAENVKKFVPANQSGKPKKNKSRRYKRKPQKPISYHDYEGFLSLMQGMLRRMDNMDKTCKPPPQVNQVCVKNDETIHPLKGSGLT